MIRRLKSEVLKDLPEKIHTVVPLELDNPEEYRRAEEEFLDWLAETQGVEKALRAQRAQALVRLNTLTQLAARGKLGQVVEWVKEALEEIPKVVLFCVHREVLRELVHSLRPYGPVWVDGSVGARDRALAVERFQEDPHTRVFVGNIQAAGVGITLTASSHVVLVELPWTPGELIQAVDRVHRIGQRGKGVNVWYLVAHGTVEEHILRLLREKESVVAEVLGDTNRGGGSEIPDTSDMILDELLVQLQQDLFTRRQRSSRRGGVKGR